MRNQPEGPERGGWGPGPGGSAVGRGASREAEGRPWGCKARRPTRPEDRKGLRQKASAFPLARTSLRDDGTFNRGKLQGQQSACENCHRQRPAPPGRGPNGRPGQAVGSLSAEPLPLQPDASGSRPCARFRAALLVPLGLFLKDESVLVSFPPRGRQRLAVTAPVP